MSKLQQPDWEAARLDALYQYDILDTEPEAVFDNLARLAAHTCRTPIALINFIDSDRQWFKATVGWMFSELPRQVGFCPHTILQTQLLIISDACQNFRFANDPLVTSTPYIRFYAGLPLLTRAGYAIGTLCVMDWQVRVLDQKQAERLSTLARQVINRLESCRQRADAVRILNKFQRRRSTQQQSPVSLRGIFNSRLQAVVLINPQRQIQAFNEIADQWSQIIHGRKLRQGDSIYDFVESEHLHKFTNQIDAAFRGKSVRVEHVFKGVDRINHWFEFDYTPVFDDQAQVIGVYWVAINIDKQKIAVDALARSEERFRSLVQNSSDIINLLEADGTISYISASVERILGYKATDLLGKNVVAYIHPEDLPTYQANFAKTLGNPGVVVLSELRVRHTNGTWIFMEATSNCQLDNPSVRGVVVNARDMTERKRAEVVLRESESFVRAIADAIPIRISYVDAQQRYRFVNKRYEEWFGLSAAAIIGKPIQELLGRSLYERIREYVEAALLGNKVTYELSVSREGKEHDFRITYIPHFGEDGEVLGLFIMSQDITDRKHAEQQIQASLKEKEVLLKEIHHRVKNNLQVISSLLNLQSGYIEDQQVLEIFKESQNRIKSIALIHEKLYQVKNLSQINFAEYVQHLAVNLFRAYGVNSTAIALKVQVEEIALSVDTAISCGLILNELVSNCIKHAFVGGKSGQIFISLVRVLNTDNKLILTVRDNGVGFPQSIDFRNSDSLGLQLVNTLAAQLRGTVNLSCNGMTEFKIEFIILPLS